MPKVRCNSHLCSIICTVYTINITFFQIFSTSGSDIRFLLAIQVEVEEKELKESLVEHAHVCCVEEDSAWKFQSPEEK